MLNAMYVSMVHILYLTIISKKIKMALTHKPGMWFQRLSMDRSTMEFKRHESRGRKFGAHWITFARHA